MLKTMALDEIFAVKQLWPVELRDLWLEQTTRVLGRQAHASITQDCFVDMFERPESKSHRQRLLIDKQVSGLLGVTVSMGDTLGLSRKWHMDWIQEAQAIADEEPVEISQPVKNMTAVFDLVETARLGSAHNMRMPVNATTPIPTDPRGQFKREVQLRTIELAAQTRY